jgi:hypothetical protein
MREYFIGQNPRKKEGELWVIFSSCIRIGNTGIHDGLKARGPK